MSEELVPPDFMISPELFERDFYSQGTPPNLHQLALDGQLKTLRNRFISWRMFLDILPKSGPLSTWVDRVGELRSKYKQLVDSQRKVDIQHLDPLLFNPLSQVTDNPWNGFHVDNELKQKIRLDVERTFQERPLFLLPEIQDMMVSILFTWAKCNAEISYRQGMNEILGILVFVGYADMPNDMRGIGSEAAEFLAVINNREHLEADIYWCFARVMNLGISELFNPVVNQQSTRSKKQDLFSWDAEKSHNELVNKDKSQEQGVSSILRRCHKVHHQLLQSIDKELFNHIESKKTEPQMYLQRWLRCMLSREFNLADTLQLWDAVFANYSLEPEKELILLDYLCIAMIVFVRAFCKIYSVIESDQSGILRRLLKYPPVEDVHILVQRAIEYKTKGVAPQRINIKAEIAPALSNFGMVKKTVNVQQPKIQMMPTNSALAGTVEEAIVAVEGILNEKTLDGNKGSRVVELLNKIKNMMGKESESKVIDPLSRK